MAFGLFRRSYTLDAEYMPLFVTAWLACTAHAAYDYQIDLEETTDALLATNPSASTRDVIALLARKETPLRAMFIARAQLQARKPLDRRFSTNLHRRMIWLIDWQERELASFLDLIAHDPTNTSKLNLQSYAKASRASHATSGRVDAYGEKIIKELSFIYERFPELRPHLAPIFDTLVRS